MSLTESLEQADKDEDYGLTAGQPTAYVSEMSGGNRLSPFRVSKIALAAAASLVVLGLVAGLIILLLAGHKNPNADSANTDFSVTNLQLRNVKPNTQLEVGNAERLRVNGQLEVRNTLVLTPGNAPA